MNRSVLTSPGVDYAENAALSAAPTVSSFIETLRDNADFATRLTAGESMNVSGLGERYYTIRSEFEQIRAMPIPPELHSQMKQVCSRFGMGIFPEIRRAWTTIDSELFLWDYHNNDDLAFFDSITASITKVALAVPKPNVFKHSVKYLLVVATVVEVLVFAVNAGATPRQIVIDSPALFTVDLDKEEVTDIVTTPNGRIFFSAKDIVYEFEYTEESWYKSASCRMVNRSLSLLQTLVPFLSSTPENISQLVYDKSRYLLYALTCKSSIQVFDLGAKESQCSKITTLYGGQIIHEATQMTNGQHDAVIFSNIVAIVPIEAQTSHALNLMAVTGKGVRLYFSVLSRQSVPEQGQYLARNIMTQSDARAQTLRLCHVRFSPGICPTSLIQNEQEGVYAAHASETSTLVATKATGHFAICAMSDLYHPATRGFIETRNEFSVKAPVWAIHTQSEQLLKLNLPLDENIRSVDSHPFYRIHTMMNEEIVIITSEAIHILEHRSPLDILRGVLFNKESDSAELDAFMRELGPINVLVLGLMLLCSERVADDTSTKDRALRMFYAFKDEPEMVEADAFTQRGEWNDNNESFRNWNTRMRTPLRSSTPFHDRSLHVQPTSPFSANESIYFAGGSATNFKPSRRHDAIYTYFARLVAPLWNTPITQLEDNKLKPLVPFDSLNWLSNELRQLHKVIEENGLVPRPVAPHTVDYSTIEGKRNAEAITNERTSLLALVALLIRTFETLALWALAMEYNISAVSSSMDPNIVAQLGGRRLCDLVAGDTYLNNDLIKGLIHFFLGDEAGTQTLSNMLRNVCPTLYSKDDALVTSAMEMLERAVRLGAGAESRRLVETAVGYMKQSVGKLSLQNTCVQLAQVKAYDAIVDLAVLRAKRDDPKQLALTSYRCEYVEGDKETADAVNRREDAYRVIARQLDDVGALADAEVARDQIANAVLTCDDELAHATLFRWMANSGRINDILKCKSKYIEAFLTHEISRGGGLKYLDLMWKFFEKSGTFDKAAKLLIRLANNTTIREIGLSQRIAYISHAIICAQSSFDAKLKGTIKEMRDNLEVANIQLQTKEALANVNTPETAAAVRELDRQLFSLQDICERYAHRFGLHQVILAAYVCASYYKEDDIHRIWALILDQEINKSPSQAEKAVLTTIAHLSQIYAASNYYPIGFIVSHMLQNGRDRNFAPSFFVAFMKKANISPVNFLTHLGDEYRSDAFWVTNVTALRFIVSVAEAIIIYCMESVMKNDDNRKITFDACRDTLGMFTLSFKTRDYSRDSNMTKIVEMVDTLTVRLSHSF